MEILDFRTPVPTLNFDTSDSGYPLSQQEYEWELQERAGIDRSSRFEEVRKELAAGQYGAEMADLYMATENSLNNGMAPESAAAFIQTYNPENGEDHVNTSLERAAAENEYTTALNDNPRTALNAAVDNDDITDINTKNEIFSGWVKSNLEYYDKLGFWKKFGAFTANLLIPEKAEVWRLRGLLPDEIKEGAGWSKQKLTDNFRDMLELAYEQLPPEEYKQYLEYVSDTFREGKKFGAVDDFMFQAFLKDAEEGITGWQDAFGVLDIATIGTTLTAKTVGKFMTKTAAKAAAGDITGLCAEAKKAFKNGDTETLLKEFVTPSAARPNQNAASIASDSRVAEMMGDQASLKEAQEFLNKHINTGIYSDEELKRMSDKVKVDVKRVFTPKSSDPVDLYVYESDDGRLIASALFGDGEGKALDAAAAGRLARRMGYEKGTYKVVKKDGAGYYVQVDRDVSKNTAYGRGLYQTCMEEDAKYAKEWRFDKDIGGLFNTITRVFGGSTRIGTEAHARGVQSDRIANAIRSYVDSTYKKSYRNLSKSDKGVLDNIYKEGQRENGGFGKWYTREELDAKGVSEQVQKSYYDFKTISDLAYLANNAEKRRELIRAGYKMYGDHIGTKVQFETLKGSNYIVADNSGNIIPLSRLQRLNPDEFTLVKVHRGTAVQDNLTATHVLLHNSEATVSDLPTFVTHYMPGGRREYMNGTMFVKIGRSWFNPSTGSELNGYAKTLIAGTDKKALEEYANEVNKVIDLWNDSFISTDVAKAREFANMDLKYFKVNSWEDVKQLIRSKDNPTGIIDPKYKAQILEKNGTYTYSNSLQTIQEDLNDVDWAMQDLLTTRSQYNRARGNLLDDVNGGTAHIMNIQDIMDRTAEKAIYSLSKGDLAHWYAKDLEHFKSVITNWDDLQKYSDLDKINKAVLLDSMSANPEQLKMIRSARRYLEHGWRTLNGRTKYDKILENTMLKTAKVVDAVLPGNFRTTDAFEYIANFNPAKIAKGIGFNYVMGWWNPAQLYKQGLGVLNVMALEPKKATQAFSAYPTVRLALSARGKNKGIYGTYKAAGMKLTGLNEKEFEDMLDFMERYGTKKSSGLLVANEYGATLRGDKSLGKRFWDSQYIFMNEGNAANYFVADITAYMARKDKGWKDIAAYSDDLFLNMTKTSESAFQRGQFLPTSVFTQWMTYPTRMIEAMTNSRLSVGQKLRLAGSQFLLWGVGGTLLTDKQELNMYTGLQNHGLSQGEADFVTNGLLGYIAKLKGIHFDEGLHLFDQLDFVGNVAGMFTDQELKFPSIPASQAWNQGVAIVKSACDLIAPEGDQFDFDRWAYGVATRKGVPSSMKNLTKAIIAWKYHNFYNNKGQQINKEDVETYRAVMQALGFQPYEQKFDRMMQVALMQKDDVIKDALESLKPHADAIRFYESVDIDPDKNERNLDELYHNWDLNAKIVRDSIANLYPEGDVLRKFDKGLANLFYTGNTTETLEVKTVKGLGTTYLEMLKRKMKENR